MNYWINYIKKRISQNKNFLCLISGQTGSGKSWSALSICEQLNENFNVKRCFFRGRELMEWINSDEAINSEKGTAMIFDEAGVDLSNRDWYSVRNKMLNFLLQTFRHKNFILFFTTPYSDFIDAGTRKLFHAEFQTVGIDFGKKLVNIKPHLIQYNSRYKKAYYKRLRPVIDGVLVPINIWQVEKPSDNLVNEYETKKNKFTAELNKDILKALNKIEKPTVEPRKPLTFLQARIYDLVQKGITSPTEIGKEVGIARNQAWMSLFYIKHKGYPIDIAEKPEK